MIDRTEGALDRLYQQSRYREDDDLVFGHPQLGSVLDASRLRKRFKQTLARAGVREIRFHDLRHTFGTQGRCCRGATSHAAGVDGLGFWLPTLPDEACRRAALVEASSRVGGLP